MCDCLGLLLDRHDHRPLTPTRHSPRAESLDKSCEVRSCRARTEGPHGGFGLFEEGTIARAGQPYRPLAASATLSRVWRSWRPQIRVVGTAIHIGAARGIGRIPYSEMRLRRAVLAVFVRA
jgi:hypothetical protein